MRAISYTLAILGVIGGFALCVQITNDISMYAATSGVQGYPWADHVPACAMLIGVCAAWCSVRAATYFDF